MEDTQNSLRVSGMHAQLVSHDFGPTLSFEVRGDDGSEWLVVVVHDGSGDGSTISIIRCEATNQGAPEGLFPVGGIDFNQPRLPREVAYAVERALTQLWSATAGSGGHAALLAAGFKQEPRLLRGQTGRRPKSMAMRAIEIRRLLQDPGAAAEKALNRARDAGVLRRPPHAREFTDEAREVLAEVDACKQQLRATAGREAALPFSREIVEAALKDVRGDN
jgi:hypothetical protein